MIALRLLIVLVAGLVAVGCGEEEAADNAVEADEQNTVRLDGLRYRVNLFRQLNPAVEPDEAIYGGPRPGEGEGLYAAFLRVCNPSGSEQSPTGDVVLEDAFGQTFEPLELEDDNAFAYRPRAIAPDRCLPDPDSAAARTADGMALVFRVPFDSAAERPLVLELRGAGDGDAGRARIILDL
jgi:hypothetical protein